MKKTEEEQDNKSKVNAPLILRKVAPFELWLEIIKEKSQNLWIAILNLKILICLMRIIYN